MTSLNFVIWLLTGSGGFKGSKHNAKFHILQAGHLSCLQAGCFPLAPSLEGDVFWRNIPPGDVRDVKDVLPGRFRDLRMLGMLGMLHPSNGLIRLDIHMYHTYICIIHTRQNQTLAPRNFLVNIYHFYIVFTPNIK